ncbi:aKG-HExxH-type peptide beta-hydroxylase [Actinokineospora sp. UTMC 2448]|uniref:aKG-HExxH-type peptide beta-hydroxylase n=1 Tax=Actinokineospora sp. UTMC 2448 TaxID=2268449 RepID=UPI0021643227|nr:HEXXH motif-containing putative peptide modification protein [Actinokineospora sp. UTMC 2448]UVS81218.1 HEXXH motif domain protein [Actinokineospora sp. UTMC 2448]
MTIPLIALGPDDLDALARGGGGPDLARLLVRARRSTTLMFIADVLGRDPRADRAWRTLAALRRRAPAAVDRVLDDPAVGAWAAAVAGRRSGRPADLAFVAAAAAIRAGVSVTVDFPRTPTGFLPSLGWLTAPVVGPVSTDRLAWERAPVVSLDGVEFTITRLPPSLLPALEQSPTVDVAAWTPLLRAAWRVLRRTDPGAAAELGAMITTLAPMAAHDDKANSSTVTDALGCVFLTFNTDPETLAATLVHELQHAKLAAVMDMHPLTTTSRTRYYAPWREDPRPVAGLLHGVYAFLGVTGFWRRRRALGGGTRAENEYARWRSAALSAACTLLSGTDLTPHGRHFVDGVARTLWEWAADPVAPTAITHAAEANTAHRRRWHRQEPSTPN